ncbi:hypothetical protein BDD12DRAFT_767460, partial [Trichophaea hybrida]
MKVLDVSGSEHWDALKAVLDIEHTQELSLIIDGLDMIEYQKDKFVKGVRKFIRHLQNGPSTTKVLLTSRPQAEIKEILDGLPCIEYDKERKECLNTLRFDNTRLEKIAAEHEGSLEWLWGHKQYQAWSSTNTSDLLVIEGKPGSGKSTLTKYFKLNLVKREPLAKQSIVASFFYSFREGELQTDHSNMLRSILYDVLNQNETFFFHFQLHLRKAIQPGKRFQWPYNSLKEILLSFRSHPAEERLYFIIDAMDESGVDDRRTIIKLLRDLCNTKEPCVVKVFLASRPITLLNLTLVEIPNIIRMQDVNQQDIEMFAESFLGPELNFPPKILRKATEYIVENARGVFIWVHLVKEKLLRFSESSGRPKEIYKFLRDLPIELDEFYNRILGELGIRENQVVEDGVKMFRFVLFAYRPLRIEELHHILAIPDNLEAEFSLHDESFEENLILDIKTSIVHCGGNFLEIKRLDEHTSVQVMHQTVLEFFLHSDGPAAVFLRSDGPVAETSFRMTDNDIHIRISVVCIRYLMLCATNFTVANEIPNVESWMSNHFEAYARYLKDRPLINYALSHLKQHLDNCS